MAQAKQLSNENRNLIVSLYQQGYKKVRISEMFKVTEGALRKILLRYENEGNADKIIQKRPLKK